MKTLLSGLFSLLAITIAPAQVTYTTNPTAQAVNTLLQGNDVTISNLAIDCDDQAIGILAGSSIGLIPDTSLALSTGYIFGLAKPNVSGGESWQTSSMGDPDFSVLGANNSSDACVVEFDVVPTFNTIQFDFTFGSEDYTEINIGTYQDICAVFVSGAGISGTQNFALVPGGDTLVSSGTISPTMNASYYVDNTAGPDVEYDGFTTRLRGTVPVQAGTTYHFKVGVADMGDQNFDSGLFFGPGDIWSEQLIGIETTDISELSIYPNPVREQARIDLTTHSGDLTLFQLFNSAGQLVRSINFNGNHFVFDRDNLPTGIYTGLIQTSNEVLRTRIVIVD